MLSSALLDYPCKRVVLLIDDPQIPQTPEEARLLLQARQLPETLSGLFAQASAILEEVDFDTPTCALTDLATAYRSLARWLQLEVDSSDDGAIRDHTDRWFSERIVAPIAARFDARADTLEGSDTPLQDIRAEHAGLLQRFRVEFTSFERKRYANFSHEANKAMNLNSYLSLLGRSLVERRVDGKLVLEDAGPQEQADLVVPRTPYVLTLDADSLLVEEYARELVSILETPGNEYVAVAQTPYSAVPGTTLRLERAAGATTDMQYIIHQGFTAFQGTYWVGANAILRMDALDDIASVSTEDGFAVKRYIQDRTVIEDTESTIDLVARGWTLFNHPSRLAYSATPPDAGSLLIQRRRWSNGGLIILPKLLGYLARRAPTPRNLLQAFVRVHYLASPAMVNFGLLFLFLYPLADAPLTLWIPLSAASYMALYAQDLRHVGYRRRDLLQVYALNLLLMPINLGGVVKSIAQGITGKKSPFGRTPKVGSRTAMPAFYVSCEAVVLVYLLGGAASDLYFGRYLHFAFSAINAGFLAYAFVAFVGLRTGFSDLVAPARKQIANILAKRPSVKVGVTTRRRSREALALLHLPAERAARLAEENICECVLARRPDEILASLATLQSPVGVEDHKCSLRGRTPVGRSHLKLHWRRDRQNGAEDVVLHLIPVQGGSIAYVQKAPHLRVSEHAGTHLVTDRA